MSFRFLNQAPVYLDNAGAPLSGGSLTFTDTATTTPKTVYSDKALTTPITNPVTLDSAGRAPSDIWGSGSYRVVLKNSVGTVIKTLDDVDELASGIALPTPVIDEFVTSIDGATFSMAAIRQLPDPTGSSGKVVVTLDGVNYTLTTMNAFIRTSTVTSTSTLTPDAGYDQYNVTALAAPITIANPTGTWADGQGCVIRLKDDGTGRAITFGSGYQAVGITLPTTTIATKIMYIGFIYNSAAAKYDVCILRKQA